MVYWSGVKLMVWLVYILLAVLCIGIPVFIMLKTNQARKRGCGRGCATCGNRDFCHRTALRTKKSGK